MNLNSWSKKIQLLILGLTGAGLLLLQLHNLVVYPPTQGFDARAHIEYLTYLQQNHQLPRPDAGWELHQPPLYYLIGFVLPALKAVQALGLVSWFLIGGAVWWLLADEDLTLRSGVVLIVLAQPVLLYQTPAISNELWFAAIASWTLVFYLKNWRDHPSRKNSLLLGILLGLSLLSKATGLALALALSLDQLYLVIKNKKILPFVLISVISYCLVSGWFYLRNLYWFGKPWVSAADFVPLENYAQPITPRTLSYVFSIRPLLEGQLFYSQNQSLLMGTYLSWFFDGHAVMLPVQTFSKIGWIMVFISVPVFLLILIGLITHVRAWYDQTVLLVYPAILWLLYGWYNTLLPIPSTVKGVFLASLIVPFSWHLKVGLKKIHTRNPWLTTLLVSLFVIIVCKQFWIFAWWYQPK